MKTYKIPKAQKITQNKHKNWCCSVEGWLEFNVPFQHKNSYIRGDRSGVESYPLTQ